MKFRFWLLAKKVVAFGERCSSRMHNRTLKPNVSAEAASLAIGEAIKGRLPFLVSRLGFTEAQCLTQTGGVANPSAYVLERIHRFTGVFPQTRDQFKTFGDCYVSALRSVDLLGLITTPGERVLVRRYARTARLCSLGALEPYLGTDPWSRHLEGLRVCVVHPFVQSIAAQYRDARERLFPGTSVLPLFSLRLVKAPQTIAGNSDNFASWSDGLEYLKREVLREDLDVAILGCGAYGLPLGGFLKAHGKTVIHLGGATQMLFGVSGARWRNNPEFQGIINRAWKPPLESERPPGWEKIEEGCYW